MTKATLATIVLLLITGLILLGFAWIKKDKDE
jgi:hypothetical protein